MFSDASILHPHDVDSIEMDHTAGRSDAEKFAMMGAVVGFVRRDPVTVGALPVNHCMEIRENLSLLVIERLGKIWSPSPMFLHAGDSSE